MKKELDYLHSSMLHISLFYVLNLHKCFSDQAQSYVYEPDSVDSRRGLKLSWTNRKVDEPNPSGSKIKATSEEKDTLLRTFTCKGTVHALHIFQ